MRRQQACVIELLGTPSCRSLCAVAHSRQIPMIDVAEMMMVDLTGDERIARIVALAHATSVTERDQMVALNAERYAEPF